MDQIQAILAGGQPQGGLLVILVGHGRQFGGIHIRRIADDEIVALSGQTIE